MIDKAERPPVSLRSLPSATWETIATGAVAWLTNGMILPLLLVYLTAARGLSPGFAGALLAGATICGLACQPLGGLLVDRIGPARAFGTALVVTATGSLALASASDTGVIVIACLLSGIGQQMGAATSPALLYSSVTDRKWYPTASAAQYMVTNACSGTGGMIAGFTVDPDQPSSFNMLFIVQSIVLTVAALLLWTRLARRVPSRSDRITSARWIRARNSAWVRSWRNTRRRQDRRPGRPFSYQAFRWAFAAALLFPMFGNQQLFSGLPLHITRIGDQPPEVVGIAFGANTYTVVFVQILALRMLHNRRRSLVVALMFSALTLAWSAVLIADQQTSQEQAIGYILAAALIGLGEVMLTLAVAPVPAMVSPPEQLGRFLATYSLARGTVQVIAPTTAGLLVDPLGGALLPSILLIGAITSGVVMVRSARRLPDDVQRI